MAKEQAGTSFEVLSADFKARKFLPLYCFCGDEPYFVDALTDLLEQYALSDMEKAFNQTIVYGKDVSVQTITEAALRPPMMAERQVVIVKEAQGLELRKEEDQMRLLNYVKRAVPSTVLVFAFKNATPDKRKALWKEVAKAPGYYEGKALYEGQVGAFVKKYAAERKFKIDEAAVELLVESTGTELSKVINELSKVVLNKEAGSVISVEDIEREVGISKEFSVFELNNAIGKKDAERIFKIAHFFAHSKSNPFVVTVSQLYSFFSRLYLAHSQPGADDRSLAALIKVSPFFVKDYREALHNYSLEQVKHILQLLNEYDLRSKGLGGTGNIGEGELLRELVYRILTEKKESIIVAFTE